MIINNLKKKNINNYIINIITTYQENRRVTVKRDKKIILAGGVPHGSVLGPTLWNVLYDNVMNFKTRNGVDLVCYVDDLAISVAAKTPRELMSVSNETRSCIDIWLQKNHLEMEHTKTVAIMLTNKQINKVGVKFNSI